MNAGTEQPCGRWGVPALAVQLHVGAVAALPLLSLHAAMQAQQQQAAAPAAAALVLRDNHALHADRQVQVAPAAAAATMHTMAAAYQQQAARRPGMLPAAAPSQAANLFAPPVFPATQCTCWQCPGQLLEGL